MARKERKKILAFAVESTYGVDAIAAGSPQYLLGREFSITPMAGESQSLEYDNGQLGNSQQIVTELYVTLEFTVDLSASSAVATAAPYADLLSACLRKTETDVAECRYVIDEESTESITLYFYQSGALHKVTGARGSMSITAQAKNFGGIKFTFSGLFSPVESAVLPAANFDVWQTPLKIGVQNSSFAIDGTPLKMISLEYDQANSVVYQEYVGHEEIIITDYAPTGTIVIEAPDQTTWDAFAKAEAGATHSITFANGPLGNQVEWSSSKVQLGRPTYGEQDGTQTLSIPLIPIGNVDLITTR